MKKKEFFQSLSGKLGGKAPVVSDKEIAFVGEEDSDSSSQTDPDTASSTELRKQANRKKQRQMAGMTEAEIAEKKINKKMKAKKKMLKSSATRENLIEAGLLDEGKLDDGEETDEEHTGLTTSSDEDVKKKEKPKKK